MRLGKGGAMASGQEVVQSSEDRSKRKTEDV